MKQPNQRWRRLRFTAAGLLAGLVLAGCSSTHVGETWQCPLAQSGSCDSVAAADPAVPARAESGFARGLPVPLYRVRAERDGDRPREMARAEQPCDTECGPFAWLARLFVADADKVGGPASASPAGDTSAVAEPPARSVIEDTGRPAAESSLPLPVRDRPADDARAPADTAGGESAPAVGDNLREAEIVGRIWIAPFVDAGGIYREGAYVRAVLAPAGWKNP